MDIGSHKSWVLGYFLPSELRRLEDESSTGGWYLSKTFLSDVEILEEFHFENVRHSFQTTAHDFGLIQMYSLIYSGNATRMPLSMALRTRDVFP